MGMINKERRSDCGQSPIGGVEEGIGGLVVLRAYPFALEYAPQRLGDVEMRRGFSPWAFPYTLIIPSFLYRLSHLLTVCCSISVLSPTFAADSPSAFRSMAKHLILKHCFFPRRYPISSSIRWASFSSNRSAFLISSKVCIGITRIAA